MKSSLKARELSRVEMKQTYARERVAFEKSRVKPEDAAPLARKPTFFTKLRDVVRRFFGRLFRINARSTLRGAPARIIYKPKPRKTPPRAFGKPGRKLSHRLTTGHSAAGWPGRRARQYAARGYGYIAPEPKKATA